MVLLTDLLLLVCLAQMCSSNNCNFPPYGYFGEVDEGAGDEVACAMAALKTEKGGFEFTDGKCNINTMLSPKYLDKDNILGTTDGKLTKFSKRHLVLPDFEAQAKAIGFDHKIRFTSDDSVRYYKRIPRTFGLFQCEKMCLSGEGIMALLHTKEHVEQLQSDGFLSKTVPFIGVGLKMHRGEKNMLIHWLDGSVVYNGTIEDFDVCSEDLGDLPDNDHTYGVYQSIFVLRYERIRTSKFLFSRRFERL